METPINITSSGHIEPLTDKQKRTDFTQKDFKQIKKGDIVFFGKNEHGKVHDTLTNSVYLEGSKKQIYLSDLRHPFVKRGSAKKETLAAAPVKEALAVKKSMAAPKVKNPETIKLENLIKRYSDHEEQIMREALSGRFTTDEIEAGLLMQNASKKARMI